MATADDDPAFRFQLIDPANKDKALIRKVHGHFPLNGASKAPPALSYAQFMQLNGLPRERRILKLRFQTRQIQQVTIADIDRTVGTRV